MDLSSIEEVVKWFIWSSKEYLKIKSSKDAVELFPSIALGDETWLSNAPSSNSFAQNLNSCIDPVNGPPKDDVGLLPINTSVAALKAVLYDLDATFIAPETIRLPDPA